MWDALAHFVIGAGNVLLGYGLQGVVMGGMGWMAWLLRQDRNNMFKLYCDVQEKRMTEASTFLQSLNANTSALVRISDALIRGAVKPST